MKDEVRERLAKQAADVMEAEQIRFREANGYWQNGGDYLTRLAGALLDVGWREPVQDWEVALDGDNMGKTYTWDEVQQIINYARDKYTPHTPERQLAARYDLGYDDGFQDARHGGEYRPRPDREFTTEWGVRNDSTGRVEVCSEASAAILSAPGVTPVNRLVGPWTPATPQPPTQSEES